MLISCMRKSSLFFAKAAHKSDTPCLQLYTFHGHNFREECTCKSSFFEFLILKAKVLGTFKQLPPEE